MNRPAVLGTLALLLSLAVAPAASADASAERAGARAAAQEGVKAYDAGDWEKAVDYFQRAEDVVHAPPHLLYIARAQVKLGLLVEGRENYMRIIREKLADDAPTAFVSAQESANAEIEGLEARIPTVTVTVQGNALDQVVVTRDGQEMPAALVGIPQPINPGSHVFMAAAGDLSSEEHTVEVSEGGEATVMLTLRRSSDAAPDGATAATPEDSKGWSGMKVAGVTTLGLGVAGAAVGGVFAGLSAGSRADANALTDACSDAGCSADQIAEINALDDDANTQGTIGVIGLAAGGAAIITGVTLLIVDAKNNKKQKAASLKPTLRPWFGISSVGLSGTF